MSKQSTSDINNSKDMHVSNWKETYNSFDEMNLNDNILRGIYGHGWEKPSPVQSIGIVPVIKGRDCIIQAQSGTGKTGTFCIASLQKINISVESCQVIILSPTREIADQSNRVCKILGQHIPNINIIGVIGGKQLSSNDVNKSHILIGTPGRVFDMIKRGNINMGTLNLFILDEADIMLNRGFKEQLMEIFTFIPKDVQIAIFSATMPNEILSVTNTFMNNPVRILVKNDDLTLEGIKQFYIGLNEEKEKYDTLCDIYDTLKINQSIIYCASKRKVEWLADEMIKNEFPVSYIHGDMNQDTRDNIMKEYRNGTSRVLITTDLLSRGIDIHQVSLVINFDFPSDKESYIHRIGRSGRYGKKGVAVNFITQNNVRDMRDIEKFYNTQIEEMPVDISQFM